MVYRIGENYLAILNNEITSFIVLDIKEHECLIKWEDGYEEWSYILDMNRWVLDSCEVVKN
ncbi:hypothetical protein [Enterocloster bolteae]|jgi:hypothetical protein|uniref:hypothetical protein n=1 Tax=Enterocloster bolteae TaxID=208479 RepID=UPI000E4C24DD|nr:hypothetical protein [Enterocloster bolteae]RGS05048.1 hypothetical protein DWY12_23675 [Enterocloster bolteae]